MNRQRAIRLAREWAQGHVCSLRDGEAAEYHAMFASMLTEALENEPMTWEALKSDATSLSTLQAENAKLKKERDAAITDLEELIAGSWDAACEYCAKLHSKEPCREEDGSCKPKWRGIQEGVEDDR